MIAIHGCPKTSLSNLVSSKSATGSNLRVARGLVKHRRSCQVQAQSPEGEARAPAYFSGYTVYKGKAAVAFKPIAPTWMTTLNKENAYMSLVDREGALLIEAANVLDSQGSQQGFGNRSYGWDNKIMFSLKATELAALADFDSQGSESNEGLQFFHDPNKGTPGKEGTITKTLKLNYASKGGGYMLSVSSRGIGGSQNVSVPLTRAEYMVVKTVATYMIPHILGIDMTMMNPLTKSDY